MKPMKPEDWPEYLTSIGSKIELHEMSEIMSKEFRWNQYEIETFIIKENSRPNGGSSLEIKTKQGTRLVLNETFPSLENYDIRPVDQNKQGILTPCQ